MFTLLTFGIQNQILSALPPRSWKRLTHRKGYFVPHLVNARHFRAQTSLTSQTPRSFQKLLPRQWQTSSSQPTPAFKLKTETLKAELSQVTGSGVAYCLLVPQQLQTQNLPYACSQNQLNHRIIDSQTHKIIEWMPLELLLRVLAAHSKAWKPFSGWSTHSSF